MKGWIACIVAALFFAYELIQLHVMNAISPFIMQEFSLTTSQFGLLASSYLFADILFLLPAGRILDRFSVRTVILYAMIICLIGTVGFALSTSYEAIFFFHFLSGIGNAFCFLSCMLLINSWFIPEKRSLVVGLVVTIGMLGSFFAQAPFSLLSNLYGWRNTFLIDAVIGILLFALLYLFVRMPHTQDKKQAPPFWASLKEVFSYPEPMLYGLYTGAMNLPLMLIGAVWGSMFLMQVHHFSLETASMTTGYIALGTIIGSSFFGWLNKKLENKHTLLFLGGIVTLFLMALLFVAPGSTMPMLFFAIGMITSIQVLGYPFVSQAVPTSISGMAMGINGVVIMGMAALAQPVSGYLMSIGQTSGSSIDTLGFFQAFSLVFIAIVYALIALGIYLRKRSLKASF